MNNFNFLCVPTKQINILGKQIEIKPLSIKDAIKLAQILATLKVEVKSAIKQNPNFMLPTLLRLASTNKARELLDIFTQQAFVKISKLEEKLSLLELSELFKAVCEVNDFSKILINFQIALKEKNN